MTSTDALPPDVLQGALLLGNEWAWALSSFPDALKNAEAHGYACLGGQFQFRLPDGGTCEMYWISADSADRRDGEAWTDYSHRSCTEVLGNFRKRISETDFANEALAWHLPVSYEGDLVFVAYFVTEADLTDMAARTTR